jgi:hypothetical protein
VVLVLVNNKVNQGLKLTKLALSFAAATSGPGSVVFVVSGNHRALRHFLLAPSLLNHQQQQHGQQGPQQGGHQYGSMAGEVDPGVARLVRPDTADG